MKEFSDKQKENRTVRFLRIEDCLLRKLMLIPIMRWWNPLKKIAGLLICHSLACAVAAANPSASILMEDLIHAFDGSPKTPVVTTTPAGLPYQVTYRELSPTASAQQSQVVYDDTPATLNLSYLSYSYAANQISGLGNYVQLGGDARSLEACETILVTWARAADWPELAAENPDGYYHPIRITLYEVDDTNQLKFITETTRQTFIPWRPLTMPNGSPYRFNGYAFRAVFPFASEVILPERVLVLVSFNTQNHGFQPIGVPGPYDTLNVAIESAPVTVGANVDRDVILHIKSNIWYYPSTGWEGRSAPMLRLRARDTESVAPPSRSGRWAVTARSSNPLLPAQATGTMVIGDDYASWLEPWVSSGAIDPASSGPNDDPDHDGISNLFEFALGLDPASADGHEAIPQLELMDDGVAIVYRKNLGAYDLKYEVESTQNLGDAESWEPVQATETILGTSGAIQVVRATIPVERHEMRRFFRLNVRKLEFSP